MSPCYQSRFPNWYRQEKAQRRQRRRGWMHLTFGSMVGSGMWCLEPYTGFTAALMIASAAIGVWMICVD